MPRLTFNQSLETSFQLVPLIDEADTGAADFVEARLVVDHVGAFEAGDEVVFAQIDRLFWADFFAHAAVDAAGHIDLEFERALFDFGPSIIRGDFRGCDFDRLGWADEFAELAGNAAFAALFVGDEGGCAAIVFWQVLVPALFGELHGDPEAGRGQTFGTDGFAAEGSDRVGHGEEKAFDEGSEIDFLTEIELRALEFDDGHGRKKLRSRGGELAEFSQVQGSAAAKIEGGDLLA